jgi:hypothetical protein
MATTTAKTPNQQVLDQLKLSMIRNDLREINTLASTALNDDLAARAALRTILRISREAIYR